MSLPDQSFWSIMSLQHEGCKRDTRSTEDKLLSWIQDVPHLIFSYSPETLTQCLVFFGLFGSLIILRVFFYYFIFQLCVFSLCVFSSVSNVFHGVPQVRLSSLHLCLVSCYVTSYFILVVPCLVCLVLGVTSLCLIYFSFLSQVSSFCQNQLSIHILSQALLVLCWVVLHGCV